LVLYPQLFGLAQPSTECPELRGVTVNGSTQTELTALCPEQWFELNVDQGSRLVMTVDSDADSYLELFDAAGTGKLAEDDDSGPGYNPNLAIELEGGTYRLLLHPYRSGTGPLTLRVQ